VQTGLSTAQHSTECGQATAQRRVWLGRSTVQHSMAQHSTECGQASAQHSTAQHRTAQGVNTFASTGSMLTRGDGM